MYELSLEFNFDSAHTLERVVETEGSRRIHGHSYWARVTIRGVPDPVSGMLMDLALFRNILMGVRDELDHHFLDDIADLKPATIENLSSFIWKRLAPKLPNLYRVSVSRKSYGDACDYYGPNGKQ